MVCYITHYADLFGETTCVTGSTVASYDVISRLFSPLHCQTRQVLVDLCICVPVEGLGGGVSGTWNDVSSKKRFESMRTYAIVLCVKTMILLKDALVFRQLG